MISPARAAAGVGAAILLGASAPAQEIIEREGAPAAAGDAFFVVPFLFQNDTIGTAIGATAAARGWPQPQALTYLTGVASTEGTTYLYLRGSELQWPGSDRLFLDLRLSAGHFSRIDTYVDGQPGFADEVAGSHDSDPDNFVESEGEDILARLEFGYVLPLGDGAQMIKPRITLRDGIRVAGGRTAGAWNPLQRGTTRLVLTPFYRTQDVSSDERGDEERTTSGLEFALQHDHTDFSENPTSGSFQQVRWAQDFGGLGSSAPWETWDVTLTKYISLGSSETARQRVLALSTWWIDTPSWDERDGGGSDDPYQRPPVYAGATLGGLERLRGFPQNRFHDRSAVYYGAEYRHTLDWNPLRGSALLRWLRVRVDWLQAVAFAEAGRVHDEFDPGELHTDLQTSGGVGLRAFANHLVIRADLALSEEDTLVQMTIDHPF